MTNPELNRQHLRELNRQKVRPTPGSGPIWFGVGGLAAGVLSLMWPYLWFVPGLPFLASTGILPGLSIVLSAIGLRRGMSGRVLAGVGLALGILLGADLAIRLIVAASLRTVPF
jgi:hypothetical protein